MTRRLAFMICVMLAFSCTKKKVVPQPSERLQIKAEMSARPLLETAVNNGYVRVILEFKVSFDPTAVTTDNIATVQREIKEIQDEILKTHFRSAESPKEGMGFPRGVRRFDVSPKLTVNLNVAELEAVAANPLVLSIQPDGLVRAN